MLIAQWQEGVTRKDLAKAFSFREFKEVSFPCSVIVRVSINLFKLNRGKYMHVTTLSFTAVYLNREIHDKPVIFKFVVAYFFLVNFDSCL